MTGKIAQISPISRKDIVTNLPGEAKRQLIQKERGDMKCMEYMEAIKEQT